MTIHRINEEDGWIAENGLDDSSFITDDEILAEIQDLDRQKEEARREYANEVLRLQVEDASRRREAYVAEHQRIAEGVLLDLWRFPIEHSLCKGALSRLDAEAVARARKAVEKKTGGRSSVTSL